MIPLTLQEAADVLQAVPTGASDSEEWFQELMPEVSTDSRNLISGSCFVAIRGTRFDGHDFIGQAVQTGARVIIHSEPLNETYSGYPCLFLQVRDTTVALQTLAHYVRSKWGKTVVGITGSVGKTTTRQFAATLLAEQYEVFESPRNFNNEYGVPISLLGLAEHTQVAVLELGMNHPGEIRLLSRICFPNIAVITNVAPVHLEFFDSLEAIAAAKGEILEHLDNDGRLIYNADDPLVCGLAADFSGHRTSFGTDRASDVRIADYGLESLCSMTFQFDVHGHLIQGHTPFVGKHFLYNMAAAIATATALGVRQEKIEAGLGKLRPARMRGRVLKVQVPSVGEITLLDDSYNSNPAALHFLLETVAQVRDYPRIILALGEMLELGESSPELHRAVGKSAVACHPELLVAVGTQGKHFLEGAEQAGLDSNRLHLFEDSTQAIPFILAQLEPGDLVICKGSRGTSMDHIVTGILSTAKGWEQ